MKHRILICALLTALCCFAQPGISTAGEKGFFSHKKDKKRDDTWGTKDLLTHKVYIKADFFINHAEVLGFDEEAVNKIRDIKTNLKKEDMRTKTEIDVAHIEMRNEIQKGKTNGIKVPSLIDKEYELKKKIGKEAYNSLTELDKMLSPEQKEKAQALFKEKFKKSRYSKKNDPLLYQF